MTTTTSHRLRVAHHEAAHAVAAQLAGAGWTAAELAPADQPGLEGVVRLHSTGNYLDPMTRGWIHWAGPAAEARFTGRPLADVIRSTSCSLDRAHYGPVLSRDPGLVASWSATLDENWPFVERAAVTLALRGSLAPNDALEPLATVDQVLAGFR